MQTQTHYPDVPTTYMLIRVVPRLTLTVAGSDCNPLIVLVQEEAAVPPMGQLGWPGLIFLRRALGHVPVFLVWGSPSLLQVPPPVAMSLFCRWLMKPSQAIVHSISEHAVTPSTLSSFLVSSVMMMTIWVLIMSFREPSLVQGQAH